MNSIDAPAKRPRLAAESSPPVLFSRQVDQAWLQRPCLRAWERVRRVPAQSWRALPAARQDAHPAATLSAADALDGRLPYAAIASEVEHAIEHGTRGGTALACTLLAAIALACHDGADDAVALARAALEMAAQPGQPQASCVRVMHAALVTARTVGLHEACGMLLEVCRDGTLPLAAQLQLAATAFAAGMPLGALSQRLDKIGHERDARQAHMGIEQELALRRLLVRTLACPHPRPARAAPGMQQAPREPPRAGYWITRLQVSWYDGKHEDALDASTRATGLIHPLTPVADVLCYHLFSLLALGRRPGPKAVPDLDMHCLALHRYAAACPPSGAIAALASAVRERCAGRYLPALQGLEQACANATRHGQHWVAALAAEEAALAAAGAGLASVVAHYRQQALASCQRWGALGRMDRLQGEWGELPPAPAAEQRAEHERLRRAGKAGELGLSIAHEVNQPLAAIALHASAARKWLRRPQPDVDRALASLELIGEAGRHAGDIVRGIQRMASHQENEIGCVAVDETINEALRVLERSLRRHAIGVELALGLGDTLIQANRVQFRQVLTNLFVNAIEALAGSEGPAGARRIRVASRLAGGEEVEIVVEDNGPGIAPANRERVFGSLFTTKPGNTGLGLSISLAIVRAHHGSLGFEPCAPQGARFLVRLPVCGPQSQAESAMV